MESRTHTDAVTTTARDRSLSETVIDAVAAVRGVDPIDLEPLYATIDPDLIDSMPAGSKSATQSPAELRFTWAGCTVIASADGGVIVEPVDESQSP